MNQQIIDGILVTRPTADDIAHLQVGDLAPDVFGDMQPVLKIYGRGLNVHGDAFVLFYTRFGVPGGSISGELVEGKAVPTVRGTDRWNRLENVPKWEGYRTIPAADLHAYLEERRRGIEEAAERGRAMRDAPAPEPAHRRRAPKPDWRQPRLTR